LAQWSDPDIRISSLRLLCEVGTKGLLKIQSLVEFGFEIRIANLPMDG